MLALELHPDRIALAADGVALDARDGTPDAGSLRALLTALPTDARRAAVLLVPAGESPEALGRRLTDARAGGLDPLAFVDASLVAGAAFARRSPPFAGGATDLLHVELQGAAGTVTLLRADARGVGIRRHAATGFGRAVVQRDLLRLAARAIVRGTRFDPLHDARHEAALRDLVRELLPRVAAEGSARGVLRVAGRELELVVSADQVAGALEPWSEMLRAAISGLQPAPDAALLVPAMFASLPGAVDPLVGAGFEVFREEDGDGLVLASRLRGFEAPAGDAVPLLRRLDPARLGDAAPFARVASARGADDIGTDPTHLLAGGVAHRIDAAGVVLGRAPGEAVPDGAMPLPVGGGAAGVSRRHCTVRREGSGVVVIDHSRHGSFVDGRRVIGRARLRAGNRLRLGTPGTAVELIAVPS